MGNEDDIGEETGVVRVRCDWASKAPSTAVAETVAVAVNDEPDEMEPLYTYIDPDALDALVSPGTGCRCEATDSVSFMYDVTVLRSGEVSVRKNDSD
ncbi:HalOD1 output domain-containing protein [Haladaptatus sp. DYF46]|uniref:HalOD1 output domain-containing protein n=1 Tax=Haladaptatus sp. DYF46 TaxID=2886041 RepID=UPI001E35F72E|nr:HalOD1 output domain-containing protein [Haladaptatus sp. DYF46]